MDVVRAPWRALHHRTRPYHGLVGTSQLDPFGADVVQMPYLIATWGQGRYAVREILHAPVRWKRVQYLDFLVIQRFS